MVSLDGEAFERVDLPFVLSLGTTDNRSRRVLIAGLLTAIENGT